MDLPFEQLLVFAIAAVALLLQFLRRRPPEDGNDTISSQPTPAPYFPGKEVKTWLPSRRPVKPATSLPTLAYRTASASETTVPASAFPRAAPAPFRPRLPWLEPVARDQNTLRRAIVLMAVFGPPRALAPLSEHAAGEGDR